MNIANGSSFLDKYMYIEPFLLVVAPPMPRYRLLATRVFIILNHNSQIIGWLRLQWSGIASVRCDDCWPVMYIFR